jgi:ribosome-associated translation inhibitor RaiA
MNDTKVDIERLGLLQRQFTETQAVIVAKRAEVQRLTREVGDCRISHIVDPENYDAKATQSRIKQLEADLAAAERQIQKAIPEAEALAAAIARIESDVLPRRHAERVRDQAEIRQRYRNTVIRIRDASEALYTAFEEARKIYESARGEYPGQVSMDGQTELQRNAGLLPLWEETWIRYGGQTSRRDDIMGRIWDWDRTLIDVSDPVSLQRLSSEKWFQNLLAENERKQRAREAASHAQEPHPLGFGRRISPEEV